MTITIKDSAEVLLPIIKENYGEKKIILKCDCEGGEYDIFESLDNAGLLSKIDAIAMEWHGQDRLPSLKKILLKNGFAFAANHFNINNIGMIYAFSVMECRKGSEVR